MVQVVPSEARPLPGLSRRSDKGAQLLGSTESQMKGNTPAENLLVWLLGDWDQSSTLLPEEHLVPQPTAISFHSLVLLIWNS